MVAVDSLRAPDEPVEELTDAFGRVHRDLRISITDRCNFRCTYCMPEDGLPWLQRDDILSFEEIGRVARVAVARFGISSIRLTGGEPTVRAGLTELVTILSALGVDLSMTTNGSTLARSAAQLRRAGLRRVNISLDSLRPERFAALARRDALADVLAGIDAAVDAGLEPVKVNVVLVAGVNDDEILDFARFGRERHVTVRFIEYMPLDADGCWDGAEVVGLDRVLAAIEPVHPVEPIRRGHAPAERYRYRDRRAEDGPGSEIGIIPSVTRPFCGSCDRVRLTAEGKFRNCLFSVDEVDLRPILRGGGTDEDLASAMRGCVAEKRAGHGIGTPAFIRPVRSMSQIGG